MPLDLRSTALTILHQGLAAVNPVVLFKQNVSLEGRVLSMCDQRLDLSGIRRLVVIGIGKGAAPLAQAAEEVFGEAITDGAVVVNYGSGLPLRRLRLFEAGHPIPDEATLEATQQVLNLLHDLTPDDLVLLLLTGGGSALLEYPVSGISLAEVQTATDQLLACGAAIWEINAVRKHFSRVKGGQLLRTASPARVITLAISDVIGDPPEAIASGPTSPDSTTFAQVWQIIEKYSLRGKFPPALLDYLQQGLSGIVPETPKPGDALFTRATFRLIGTNRQLLEGARWVAQNLGFDCLILTDRLCGEARDQGRKLAALLRSVRPTSTTTICLLAGGETTVTLRGSGQGGRNQELALAAAVELDGTKGCLLLSAGSDGADGPTGAAGAWVDGTTVQRARRLGLNAAEYLERNDSYSFFHRLGDQVITGPTRTNVMDVVVMLVEASA